MAELVLSDVVVVDVDGFLAVELLGDDKEVLLPYTILGILFLATSEEGHEAAPALLGTMAGILTLQFVEVFFA